MLDHSNPLTDLNIDDRQDEKGEHVLSSEIVIAEG